MRFIMVYSSSPTLCGNYAYGNTVDFKTTITGAVDPINHSGYVYGAEEEALWKELQFNLKHKTKTRLVFHIQHILQQQQIQTGLIVLQLI